MLGLAKFIQMPTSVTQDRCCLPCGVAIGIVLAQLAVALRQRQGPMFGIAVIGTV